jgi:hypothetical protein
VLPVVVAAGPSPKGWNPNDDDLGNVWLVSTYPATVTKRVVVVIRDQQTLATEDFEALDGL